jgi:hypothetical protein
MVERCDKAVTYRLVSSDLYGTVMFVRWPHDAAIDEGAAAAPAFSKIPRRYSSNLLRNSASSLSRSTDRKNVTGLHFP